MNKEVENLIFKQPEKRSKSQTLMDLRSADGSLVCEAIISVALYEEDLDFCIKVIVQNLKHSDSDVRAASVLSIGHLARIHQDLPNSLIPIILDILSNEENIIKRRAHSMREDLQQFMPEFWKKIVDAYEKKDL